ncbi:ATP-dependent helicase HrpB [Arcticibacter sp. MXS-1]|uniref:ATP-dependent helicase HrpB n=1 Tax=Arcticibacter sp. MXS-1 TaxID=3341726 RepID=UPI0035A90C67
MAYTFDPYKTGLPVVEIIEAVRRELGNKNTLIVGAPPGAGKSTVLPLALMEEPWLQGKKIIMLEPRRLAAGTIANRMASLLGEKTGKRVGYRIRFENKISAETRIEVVTEGILTRMLQSDNALEDVGLVIFDEFHERSIHADTALALCRESQQILRPDLRIMVMSATLDTERLADLLSAPVVESKGALYPVEVIYTGEQDLYQIAEQAARVVSRALREQEGDILVFLPGQAEIRKCESLLQRLAGPVSVHPLYGQLSFAEQNAAIMPSPEGKRKVVLSTSIAETSLTIEGIRVVVDSGYTRLSAFDPRTGLSGLKTAQVSLDSAEQRKGRAGRLGPGVCYRMWSLATHERLAPFRTPEILEADLAPLLLDLMEWGIQNVSELTWLNAPPASSLNFASELLEQLEAADANKLTAHGRQMHRLPCHPRIAHMLIRARSAGVQALATDVAALLEERDPLENASSADLNLRIQLLRRYRSGNFQDRRLENVEKVASAYRRLLQVGEENAPNDNYQTGLLLSYAYPERIAKARPGFEGQFQLANGKTAALSADDDLAREPWLSIAQIDSKKGVGKIFIAAPVNPADLLPFAQEQDLVEWNVRKGGLVARRDRKIGSLSLESENMRQVPEEQLVEAICAAVRLEGQQLLDFTEATQQWQARLMSLRIWRPEEDWPDVRTDSLLKEPAAWLAPYLAGVRKNEDLRRIDLVQVLQQSLDYEKQQSLDKLVPAAIKVPSGSMIRLRYSEHGEPPVLAVRLQEVFGMMDTPRINGGRQGVVLHLLSPGFKPVQVTSDLRSFWKNTYFEVRKELKRRYPRHSWPEDPLNAEAVSGVRRRSS